MGMLELVVRSRLGRGGLTVQVQVLLPINQVCEVSLLSLVVSYIILFITL